MAGGSWKGPQKILNNTRDVILIKMLETWFLPSSPSRSLQQLFKRKPLASDFFLASPAAAVFWFNWFSQLVCVDFTLGFGTVASAGLLAGGTNGFAGLAFVPQLFRFVSVNVDAGDVGVVGDANWLASAAADDWKVTVWEGDAGVEAEGRVCKVNKSELDEESCRLAGPVGRSAAMGDEREEKISVGEEARAGDEIGRSSRVGEFAAVGDARYLG